MSIDKIIAIIIVSMLPGVEARGAYPLAYAMGYTDLASYLLIFASSTFPSIPIIYGLTWFEKNIIREYGFLKRLYDRVVAKIRSRAEKISRYSIVYIGLTLYVAIPLPGTGVWTGSLIAYLLGLDKYRSLIAIAVGNMIACTIIYSFLILLKIVI